VSYNPTNIVKFLWTLTLRIRYSSDNVPMTPLPPAVHHAKSESATDLDRYSPTLTERTLLPSLPPSAPQSPQGNEAPRMKPFRFPNLSMESFRYPGRRSGYSTPMSMMSFSDRDDHSLLGSSGNVNGKKMKRRRRKKNEVFVSTQPVSLEFTLCQ
jgi:hypothetical protein